MHCSDAKSEGRIFISESGNEFLVEIDSGRGIHLEPAFQMHMHVGSCIDCFGRGCPDPSLDKLYSEIISLLS